MAAFSGSCSIVAVFLALSAQDWETLLPEDSSGWVYYVLCALFFLIIGMATGFFIWRKGHMQMLDAEAEVKRTSEELETLREDIAAEEAGVQSADSIPKVTEQG